MAYCVDRLGEPTGYADQPSFRTSRTQHFLGGIAFAAVILASGWTVYVNLFEIHPVDAVAAPTVTVVQQKAPEAASTPHIAPRKRSLFVAPVFDIALIDATKSFGLPPVSFSRGTQVRQAMQKPVQPVTEVVQVVQSVPLPMPRPAGLGALAHREKKTDDPFEKLFGRRETPRLALAYASADGGVSNDGRSINAKLPANDGQTAIYDISARTVYLPDGSKLEAHSGLRDKMDDPRHVHVKMHGATPPHVYDLVPREAPFHGVEALRLIPVGGEEAIFGRTGLLTHTYLLGPNGDSNGCVSFKNYDAFLRAYKNGQVKRMVVVASVDDPQLDLRMADRPPSKMVRTYTTSAEATASIPTDDRYLSAFSASRASRTSSSARSL